MKRQEQITRRELLQGMTLIATGMLVAGIPTSSIAARSDATGSAGTLSRGMTRPKYAYIGSRTSRERNARGVGITVYRTNPDTGACSLIQTVSDLVNPSYLALDPQQRFLYCVHGDQSEVSSFSIDEATGTLRKLNTQSTEGKNPAHLSVDPQGRFLAVANYATGSFVILPIKQNGELGPYIVLEQLPGTPGPHKVEQTGSRPHMIPFDPSAKYLVIPDKGLDTVFVYRPEIQENRIVVEPVSKVATREGAGPRHIAFAPSAPYAYVVNELDSTVTTYRFDVAKGQLEPLQIVSTLPDTYTGNNRSAEIVISTDGRFIYVSNRGHDSVASFSVNSSNGKLESIGWLPSQGKKPRFMTLDPQGKFLYVANEDSDSVVTFRVDSQSGKITPTGDVIATGSPVCMVFKTN